MRNGSFGRSPISAGIALVLLVLGSSMAPARGGEVILQIDTKINGTAPSDATPWITLDFKDIANNEVQLTITNHLQSGEFADNVLFNSLVTLVASDFSHVSGPQVVKNGITFNDNGGANMKAGIFDVDFNYTTANNSNRLSGGTSSVYDITATGLGAASFEAVSTADGKNPGGWYAAAHIQGIPKGEGTTSGSAGASTFTTLVPEPSALTLGAFGIVGLLAGRRLFRQGRA